MPKKPIDYSTRMVYFYKFVKIDEPSFIDCYVGHTVDIIKRKCGHKKACNNPNNKNYNIRLYQIMRENGGWDNWKMLVIHQQICKDDIQARQIEQKFIEELNAKINMVKAYISEEQKKEYYKEWYENNKEQKLEYNKEYRENNKEEISEKQKEWYENNKEQISEKHKEYYENNKEKISEQKKDYYENNKEKIKEYYENNKEKYKEKYKCECGGKYTFQNKSTHEKSLKHKEYCLSIDE
jgi:hypothetical protein